MTPSRALRRLSPALALAAGLAAATPALAVDRCVAVSGCSAGNTYSAAQLQSALTAAGGAAGGGRVLIGAGTFVAPAAGFSLSSAGPVEIVGAGIGATVIQTGPGQAAYSFALRMTGGANVIRHLTLRTIHPSVRPLLLGGTALGRDLRIEGSAAATNSWGVYLEGTGTGPVLEDAVVTMAGNGATAVAMNSAGTLRRASLSADRGIVSSHATGLAAVSQVRVSAAGTGVSEDAGAMTVSDSVVTVNAPGATGVSASNLNNGTSPITIGLDRVTLIGYGSSETGVAGEANGASGDDAAVTVSDSVITGFDVPLRRTAAPAGSATIATSFTNHPAAGVVDHNAGSGTGAITEISRTGFPVAFVDPSSGDFRPAPGSPLIDAGDPSDTGVADLDGGPRHLDGDGDGIARVDLGALEAPTLVPAGGSGSGLGPVAPADRTAPRITRLRITVTGRQARVRGRISEAGTLRLRIVRVGVRGARVRTVTVRMAGPFGAALRLPVAGRYRIRVVARDRAGNSSAPLVRVVRRPAGR